LLISQKRTHTSLGQQAKSQHINIFQAAQSQQYKAIEISAN